MTVKKIRIKPSNNLRVLWDSIIVDLVTFVIFVVIGFDVGIDEKMSITRVVRTAGQGSFMFDSLVVTGFQTKSLH